MDGSASKMMVSDTAVDSDQADPNVEDLLKQLLVCVGKKCAPPDLSPGHEGIPEVVFEVQMDGVRYTLTRSRPPPSQSQVRLSPREQEIVRLVAKGLPNKTIAGVLDISAWTVATHLRRIFTKLGVNSRAEMVACALGKNLLECDV